MEGRKYTKGGVKAETLRILKDGVDPESPNAVETTLNEHMLVEYERNSALAEELKKAGRGADDQEVKALIEKAEKAFNFGAETKELVSNIRAMMVPVAAENPDLNRLFTDADESTIDHWVLLLLTDIQSMFGEDRLERVLDIYSLGNLVNKEVFDRILKKYGDQIGFDAKAEFYAAMPALREDENRANTTDSVANEPEQGSVAKEGFLSRFRKLFD